MAIHDSHYYNKSIANITAVVGTIFNNLKIVRTDKNNVSTQIAVPLRQERKEHWYHKLNDNLKSSSVTFQQQFPLITYSLNSVTRDTEKAVGRLTKIKKDVEVLNSDTVRQWHFRPVPYIITYTINIMTKYTDDSLQILEQILPYFNPTINIKITENTATQTVNDVQLSLLGDPELDDNYNLGLEESRLVLWTLQVAASTNLYQPVRTAKVIKTVIVDIDNSEPLYDLETITVAANADDGNKDNNTITIEIGV